MDAYRILYTDAFGTQWHKIGRYTGPAAREAARAWARYVRGEIHRWAYVDRATDRRVTDVQVVPA